jgi:hypothetical protein
MNKKNLIKIVPLMAIMLIALSGSLGSVVLADSTATTTSNVTMQHGMSTGISGTRHGRKFVGTITGITGTTLSVKNLKGILFSVDVSTAKLYKDFASTTITVSDLKLGDSVMVRGVRVDNVIKASILIDGKFSNHNVSKDIGNNEEKGDKNHEGQRVGFRARGIVATINGSTLTVNGQNNKTYSVDAHSAVIFKGMSKATSTFTNIKSGDSVLVRGSIVGTLITATEIIDGVSAKGFGHQNKKVVGESN